MQGQDKDTDKSFLELLEEAKKKLSEKYLDNSLVVNKPDKRYLQEIEALTSEYIDLLYSLEDTKIDEDFYQNTKTLISDIRSFQEHLEELTNRSAEALSEVTTKGTEIGKELNRLLEHSIQYIQATDIPKKLDALEKEIDSHDKSKIPETQHTWKHRKEKLIGKKADHESRYGKCRILLKILYVAMLFSPPTLIVTIPVAWILTKKVEGLKETADKFQKNLDNLAQIKENFNNLTNEVHKEIPSSSEITDRFQMKIKSEVKNIRDVSETFLKTVGVDRKEKDKYEFHHIKLE